MIDRVVCYAYLLMSLSIVPHLCSFQILPLSSETRYLGYGDWDIKTNGESLVIKQFVKDGDLLFDAGAYCGDWSREAVQTHPNVKIFAFEPVPKSFETCKRNLQTYANIQFFNCALSDQNGTADFCFYPDSGFLSGFYFRKALENHHTIQALTVNQYNLADFCLEHNISKIDFLKIDTEGAEYKILSGSENLLKTHQIRAIQFEYGGCYIDARTTLKETMKLLTDAKYVIFRIIPTGLLHISQWESFLENFELSNYFAICQEDLSAYSLVSFD